MDNGHELGSQKFCFGILHKTFSPHYHQLNGLAERFIQTVKRTLSKEKLNSEDRFLVVSSLNAQPDKHRTSPTEKLFGHKLKTTLPSLNQSVPTVTQN